MSPAVAALLIDLDGVVRRFDPAVRAEVERRHGVAAGTVARAAFEPGFMLDLVEGRRSHAEWMAASVRALRGVCDDPVALVDEWHAYRGDVDPDVLEVVRGVRRTGRPVGLITNATDWLDADLARLGLVAEFDVVVNSSRLGIAKPAAGIFAEAVRLIGQPAEACAFVDDTPGHVAAAARSGLRARAFRSAADLAEWLPGSSPA